MVPDGMMPSPASAGGDLGSTKMAIRNFAIIVAAAMTASACTTGLEYAKLGEVKPGDDAYLKTLYQEYAALSGSEYAEGDFPDSDVFALRARAAADGKAPTPEEVSRRGQTKKGAKALGAARARLVEAQKEGAAKVAPAAAARAQARYDCWAQELEEGHQQDHIDACRIGFFIELAKVNQAIEDAKPKPKPKKKVKQKLSPLTFLVYFGFDKATLDAAATALVGKAANVIGATKPKVVSVIGHADRAGPSGYNATLSEKRAAAVAGALQKAGVSGRLLTVGSLGENAPDVPTADGVKEQRNRRTEIGLRY